MNPVRRERKSKFIRLFEPPKGGAGHGICPQFYTLAPGNGCPYSCSYCYLDKTLRLMKKGGGPRRYEVYTNVEDMLFQVDGWYQDRLDERQATGCPGVVLSAGEVLDSMATPEIKKNLEKVIDHFRLWIQGDDSPYRQDMIDAVTLLLLTKSTNIPDCDPSPNVVLSWSINAPEIAMDYEKGAPSPARRIEAATEAKNRGWRVRIRIDPIIQDHNGGPPYTGIHKALRKLRPERITLGTLRSSGKPTMQIEKRIEIYCKHIEELGDNFTIGLCKETPEVYEALGMGTENIKCNCTA